MRALIFTLLLPLQTIAAEIMIDGETVISTITEKTTHCGQFSVVISRERFPAKYERRIPSSFTIKGFYGADFNIGANAYFVTEGVRYRLPYANEVKGLKAKLRKATFIPIKAKCTEQGFFVLYWSGGNGRKSETGITYFVSKSGNVSAPPWLTEEEFVNLYTK